jgi:hypothetical protein
LPCPISNAITAATRMALRRMLSPGLVAAC